MNRMPLIALFDGRFRKQICSVGRNINKARPNYSLVDDGSFGMFSGGLWIVVSGWRSPDDKSLDAGLLMVGLSMASLSLCIVIFCRTASVEQPVWSL